MTPDARFRIRASRTWRAVLAAMVFGWLAAEPARAALRVDGWTMEVRTGIARGGSYQFKNGWHPDPLGKVATLREFVEYPEHRSLSHSVLVGDDPAAVPTLASAYQTLGGWNGAVAEAGYGEMGSYSAIGEASVVFTIHNSGDEPIPVTFGFLINQASAQMDMDNFVAIGERFAFAEVRASFATGIAPTGMVPALSPRWYWKGELASRNSGNFIPFTTPIVIDPQGVGQPAFRSESAIGAHRVSFNPFVGRVNVGELAPDQTMLVRYLVEASVYTGDPELMPMGSEPRIRVMASIEDPFGFEAGTFTINDQSISSLIVPEPASGLILAAAFGALALRRTGVSTR